MTILVQSQGPPLSLHDASYMRYIRFTLSWWRYNAINMVNMDPYDVFSSQFIQRIIFPASPWKWASAEAPGRIVAARMGAGFFLEELKSLVFVHPSSFSIWIHTMLKPRIAFLGRAQSDSLGKLHSNAFNSIFRQKCPVFGTLFDAEAGTREFPQHFSPGLFHYYATSSSLNEKSFERNQQLSIIKF